MNTELDDNMTLCLANCERIKLNKKMHKLFEVEDLSVASPATVSRVGIVFLTPENLGWKPYVKSWCARELFPANDLKGGGGPRLSEALKDHLYTTFEAVIDPCLAWLREVNRELLPTVNAQLIDSLCALVVSLLPKAKLNLAPEAFDETKKTVSSIFFFCIIWSIGASIDEVHWSSFDDMLREQIGNLGVSFPGGGDVHDYFVELPEKSGVNWFKPWKDIVPEFTYDPKAAFFSMLVPTIDTVRYAFVFERSADVMKPVLFTGHSGVGKSVIIADAMRSSSRAATGRASTSPSRRRRRPTARRRRSSPSSR